MSFLAIIIALVLVQVWGSGGRVQRDEWFITWQARVSGLSAIPLLRLSLQVLLPAVLCWLVLDVVGGFLFGLLWLILAVVLLLYSFGRGEFFSVMERYRGQCRSGDFEGAYLTARAELAWISEADDPVSAAEVHALVQREFVYEGYQRWFAVLFYFVLLGPPGAVAYRLLQLSCRGEDGRLALTSLFYVDWLPARLVAAAFTLTGDFAGSRDAFLASLRNTGDSARGVLYTVAEAALDSSLDLFAGDDRAFAAEAARNSEQLAGLLSRSAACWVLVLAVFVLF